MPWECSECKMVEGDNDVSISAVCHHCGRPLCKSDRHLINDDVFSSLPDQATPRAYHCEACRKAYHKRW